MSFQHFILNLAIRSSAALLSAFWQWCPAFLCSCTPRHAHQMRVAVAPDNIDVFFFDTIPPYTLDSYQRIPQGEALYALSSVGPKRVAALSAQKQDIIDWAGVRTYGDLCKYSISLKDDSPQRPILYGEAVLEDGLSRVANLQMHSCLARVELRSLACNFSQTPYTELGFCNALIYMQYAGVESRPLGPGGGIPFSMVNNGWLDSAAVMSFPRPDYLLQSGVGNVWRERIQVSKEFWCYANDIEKAAPGNPVTRIVLEGDVGEYHCYYPIELPGLKAGQTLSLDVTLLRMGSPDPDIPVSSATVTVETLTLPWVDIELREELF